MTKYVWHFHHDRLYERLLAPMARRRADIKDCKPPEEQRLRLSLFKLVKAQKRMARTLTDSQVLALHQRECPDCPWSETRQTIFTHRVRVNNGTYGRWCRPSEGKRVTGR